MAPRSRRQAGRADLHRPLRRGPRHPSPRRDSPPAASTTPTTATRAAGSSSTAAPATAGCARARTTASPSATTSRPTWSSSAGRPRLDDLRPLLLGGDGRDLPQPLLHALRPDRPAPQQQHGLDDADDLGPARGQGRHRHLLLLRHPLRVPAAGQAPPVARSATSASSSPTPRPAPCPMSPSSTPSSSTRRAALQRRPSPRRHPGRRDFMNQIYDAVTTSPAWKNTVLVYHLRRVGRVLRPRGADQGARRQPRKPRCAGSACRRWSSPRSRAGGHVAHTTYDHTSILKMIEWRWGLKPLTPRDQYARNLANALDLHRQGHLFPAYAVPPFTTVGCAAGGSRPERRRVPRVAGAPRSDPPAGRCPAPMKTRRPATLRGLVAVATLAVSALLVSATASQSAGASVAAGVPTTHDCAGRDHPPAPPAVRAAGQARLRHQLREQGLRRDLGPRVRGALSRATPACQGCAAQLLLRDGSQLAAQLHRPDLRARRPT